ncbi:hemerythrin domain-containing protein [Bordetella petrii]|uniref:hemerythrin domain-containing protein n=1 Tax=Bordetella petrii TaxID=94624 RepID=UPI001A9645E2|nr:hemerythrin domain-containing protein [Bordetella petrii]
MSPHAAPTPISPADWQQAPLSELIKHILLRYHERHRQQLPEAIRLAMKVEQVHEGHADCPHGLAEHLHAMLQELESHMRKEEQVLFPLIAQGRGALADGPIAMMRMEHDQHAEDLAQLGKLTGGLALPGDACNTWRELYAQLAAFRQDLADHIRLENTVLFPNAQAGRPA